MQRFLVLAAITLGLALAGCGDSGKTTTGGPKTPPAPDGKVAANLAKLPAADRAAAEKQQVCPVSGEPVGSMGVPIKVTVKQQDVWICCGGCRGTLVAEPDTYLAKLKQQ
jgi:hypothetical protein